VAGGDDTTRPQRQGKSVFLYLQYCYTYFVSVFFLYSVGLMARGQTNFTDPGKVKREEEEEENPCGF
jgi:hypothetical protein